MPVIDADAHVVETERTWEFMDGAGARFKPRLVTNPDPAAPRREKEFWLIDGQVFPRRIFDYERSGTSAETREAQDIDARLRHMDELGVDVHVLYTTLFLFSVTDRPEVELALHRCYNRWLADIWSKGKGRLRWAALLPYMTMDQALVEMRWAKEHGACAVHLRPFECGKALSDPYFFPLYEQAAALDLPVCIHAGNGHPGALAQVYRGDETIFSRTKLPGVGAFHNLVFAGTPKRFPTLRWGIIETSASWVPYVCHDLPPRLERLHNTPWDRSANLLEANNIFVACQTDDDLPYVLRYAGPDRLVIGSDYGHADTSTELEALRHLKREEKLPAQVVDKILEANPRALYGL
jgi:predicted TIM-barrel fold metal-dependent hydrolase